VLYCLGWALARPVPAQVGPPPASLDAEAVAFPSQSGSVIHGWLSRAPTPVGSVLLLPAIRTNRLSMVGRAEFLRRAGYSTLLIDFQATGESAGDAITFGWRERLDVLAAVQYLTTKVPGLPVGVIGVSLGGAATLLAAPPLEVQAAVLEAVYPSIDRAVVNRLEMRIGPLGRWLAPALLVQLRPRLGIAAAELRPADHIARLGCPILVIGGGRDQHTTSADTQLLFAAAREPKELWLIPDAAHVDFLEFAGDAYRRRILAFLEAALKRAPS
jgi:alpha-beta hydrolase superfamily lysophospholipase